MEVGHSPLKLPHDLLKKVCMHGCWHYLAIQHTFIDNIPTDFAKRPNEVDTRNLKVLVQYSVMNFFICVIKTLSVKIYG